MKKGSPSGYDAETDDTQRRLRKLTRRTL